ncbi:MAG: hypothetical protein A2341_04775 [Deltaproteobacteria bacterium RIFOXYB12_FULL_58_9]|nr:MAG: hypothetical protein A2341_04775 [Deltaproteobacteria bacterium RIFOXYB12_FULL_58_9]
MDTKNKERRRHERQTLERYIQIRAPGWSDLSVWGLDLSPGGIGLAVDRKVKPGDRFIFLVNGAREVEAEVCNVRTQPDEPRFLAGLRWLSKKPKKS